MAKITLVHGGDRSSKIRLYRESRQEIPQRRLHRQRWRYYRIERGEAGFVPYAVVHGHSQLIKSTPCR